MKLSNLKSMIWKSANKLLPKLSRKYRLAQQQRKLQVVEKIITDSTDTRCVDEDVLFHDLQNRYSGPGPYPYDDFSVFQRGVERSLDILRLTNSLSPGLTFLEAGCGDGMVSLALSSYGHSVMLADMEDWRDKRAQKLPFTLQNFAKGLPFSNDFFDVVFSYNSFEHFDKPDHVFNELVRTTRKNGLIFLHFGPLFSSPWGLHAYRTLLMPYPQFLFSDKFIGQKLNELGIDDLGKKRDNLQPLNRWTVNQFEKLWQRDDLEIILSELSQDQGHLNLVVEYPDVFCGRNLTLQDLTTHSIKVLARKL
ncbi:hypothetical protein MCAMS1_02099 [biofilm metagenome]